MSNEDQYIVWRGVSNQRGKKLCSWCKKEYSNSEVAEFCSKLCKENDIGYKKFVSLIMRKNEMESLTQQLHGMNFKRK